ncbi:MAG: 4-hydroxythreonine-4-phosphate dehydrogenase PdxA [Gammaproteobacteria bacterium]|nr:4-hydroxythreonine-4-phosphate dehydrogenase PdxA [Gammaproteobacteria bacterium]MCW5583386.1 4-hydroxythreonine-4-phosphate dehydrogenase PdxA [Gammaproteobacteria bacterium]
MSIPQRILITPGEPAGIGPDITVQIAQQHWPAEIIAIADPHLLLQRAKQINLPLHLTECDFTTQPIPHEPGTLKIVPVNLLSNAEPGKLDPLNAEYVIQTLQVAVKLCEKKIAGAVVTGPVHKGVMNHAGIAFTGHTEFFAQSCHVPHTVMLFVTHQLKVALATTHLPLAKVPLAITKERLRTTLVILHDGLARHFQISSPHILVCGLNPHAGESGYLGREEVDIIAPLLSEMCTQHYSLEGPLPADTAFTQKYLQRADAILAMYHDQALPLVKHISFGHAVNVTLGLPFIRTSVDHGTAIDIAGTQSADAGSMTAAVELAVKLLS